MPLTEDTSTEESVYDQPPSDALLSPEVVQPTSPSPAPSDPQPEDPGSVGGTSGEDDEPQEDAPEGEPTETPQASQPLPEFDPKHRIPFQGLLYLGALTETFTYAGHTFSIHTLNDDETIAVGLLTAPHEGTRNENRVYTTAVVAAGLDSVDDEPLPTPLGSKQSPVDIRYPWVKSNYYPVVIDVIYQRIFALEIRAREVLRTMGEAPG